MKRGQLRDEILNDCPDEFVDRLTEFINDIEDNVIYITVNFDIGDLNKLEDAKSAADELKKALY